MTKNNKLATNIKRAIKVALGVIVIALLVFSFLPEPPYLCRTLAGSSLCAYARA